MCKLGGAHGIGICEAKLSAGGDAAAQEKFRASGLKASVCLPAVLSILPLPQFAGPDDPEQRVQALIAGIRHVLEGKLFVSDLVRTRMAERFIAGAPPVRSLLGFAVTALFGKLLRGNAKA